MTQKMKMLITTLILAMALGCVTTVYAEDTDPSEEFTIVDSGENPGSDDTTEPATEPGENPGENPEEPQEPEESEVTYVLSDAVLPHDSMVYTGTKRTQTNGISVTGKVTTGETTETVILEKGTDYKITYENNMDVGTAIVTISGIGNYEGQSLEKCFEITPVTILDAVLSYTSKTYSGKTYKPAVTVTAKVGKEILTLTKNTDYTVSYANNTNAGTAKVTVKGKGNYTGTIKKSFTINKNAIKNTSIAFKNDKVKYSFTGKTIKPTMILKNKTTGDTLKKGTDYTVAYSNNVHVGTATVTITGIGNFKGTVKKTFTITKADFTNVTSFSFTTPNEELAFTGKPVTPGVKLVNNNTGKALKKGTDYTVQYDNNTLIAIGEAPPVVIITGKGNYKGSFGYPFSIYAEVVKVKVGQKVTLKGVNREGVRVSNTSGKWMSWYTGIAKVNKSGVVTGVAKGTIPVDFQYKGLSLSYYIIVTD